MAKKKTVKKAAKKSESKSKVAEKGSKISLDYTGKLESGEVFDSSKHGDHSHPLEFVIGAGQVIPGFEKAVIGMKKGEKKEFKISPEEGYGHINPQLVQKIPRSALPPGQEPKPGMVLIMNSPDGRQFPVRISKVDKDAVELDLNHPLAGKTLTFDIEVKDIE